LTSRRLRDIAPGTPCGQTVRIGLLSALLLDSSLTRQVKKFFGDKMNGHGKWRILAAGFSSYMFDAVEIIVLTVAIPVLMVAMNFTPREAGLLVTATLLGIGCSSVLIGWYADNYGRRKALLLCLLVFGALTASIAAADNWFQIMVLRFLAGIGLGGLWGVVAAYIAESWPEQQRARATSFVLSSFPVGAGLAAGVAALVLPLYGWRMLFLVCGLGAMTLAAILYYVLPESAGWTHHRTQVLKRGKSANKVSVRAIFAPELLRNTILGTLAASLALTAYWGSTTWLPTYLVKERGLSVELMAVFIVILNVGMFIGYNVFGYLADVIGKRKALILSLAGTVITLPMYMLTRDHTALMWQGPVYAFFISFAGLFGVYFAELFPTHVRAAGAGFCFNVGRGVSAFAPFILGWIATQYGLGTGIGLCAGFFFLAAVTVFFMPDDVPHVSFLPAAPHAKPL
jgi:MFS family permease